MAHEYIERNKSKWRSNKHISQWRNTLGTYASLIIGSMPVDDIELEYILKILEPIWQTKTVAVKRVIGHIELVLSYSAVPEYRPRKNPAQWRHNLILKWAKKPHEIFIG